MQHAADWAAGTGAHIGGGAGYGAGNADAAKQARDDVRDTLCHQLAVRAMPPARHTVGDHSGEQAFDAAEQGEGKCRWQ